MRKKLLNAALGIDECDLVIKGAQVANVLSLEFETADVAIKDGVIVNVGSGCRGRTEIDASGLTLIPGYIDGHLHIESTLLAPSEFARAVVPFGTTTVFPDPHEIANTCGMSGIEFMTRESELSPLDFFYGAPSCVPASKYENPYKEIGFSSIIELLSRDICTHLGEMMDFPGVIAGDESAWAKITAAGTSLKTGHAPEVTGSELCAYMLTGCSSDHESISSKEALEKLRRGMYVMMREGSASHDLRDVLDVILEDEARHSRCMAISDDLSADYILKNGHMGPKVRIMIEAGVRPIVALAIVTINAANYFRLYDRGAIAPGMIADLQLVRDIKDITPLKVWKRGELVAEEGRALFDCAVHTSITLPRINTSKVFVSEEKIRVSAGGSKIRAIKIVPGKIITEEIIVDAKVDGDEVESDVSRDILKAVVVEKNGGTGRTAVGFVNGFGLKRGAIASSVAHDAHNIIAVGVDDRSIVTAIKEILRSQGGLVAADGGSVTASLPLPIGGLMTERTAAEVAKAMKELKDAARAAGSELAMPFMTMSFLSLTVIPKLRITDAGYIDLVEGGIRPLFVE